MRVKHPKPNVDTRDCPVYACTLTRSDHFDPDENSKVWHYDDTTGVCWPTPTEESDNVTTGEK